MTWLSRLLSFRFLGPAPRSGFHEQPDWLAHCLFRVAKARRERRARSRPGRVRLGFLPPRGPDGPDRGWLALGSGGSFEAPASGRLRLQMNDNIMRDNPGGPLSVTVGGGTYSVPSTGAVGPAVVQGQTYSYSATGTWWINGVGPADANGACLGSVDVGFFCRTTS